MVTYMSDEIEDDEEVIYCTDGEKCDNKNYAYKSEIEPTEWDSWVCKECMDNKIGIELIDFIKERIKVTESEEDDQSKFIFRELVQNADDVQSQKLVLRFEEDALYVANDGRSFTATSWDGNKSDWDRISEVLKMHQADDKETTGHFGSGFQTVYALTNQPEIHSNGNSRAMNPIDKKWINDIPEMSSPYTHKEKNKGVLFRFPWRDDDLAEEEFGGIFSDKSTWPRWGRKERRALFEDLKEYIHASILCCQHLEKIRLLWVEDEDIESYQVERDFKLDGHHDDGTCSIGRVISGEGIFEDPQDFEKSFLDDDWKYQEKEEKSYHISYRKVKKDGEIQHIWKKGGGEGYVITSSDTEDYSSDKEVKKNDCYLLLPFDSIGSDGSIINRYLYSVIPLPRKSKNGFVFTSHLFPVESRKDVKIDGKFGDWYQLVMENIAELFIGSFDSFIDQAKDKFDDKDKVQKMILNNIPRRELSEWMRPGRTGGWDHDLDQKIKRKIIQSEILFSEDDWISPKRAYWGTELQREVISKLEGYPISETFWKYLPTYVQDELGDSEFSGDVFKNLWERFFEENKNSDGELIYRQRLEDDDELNLDFIDPLIEYALLESDLRDLIDLKLVPGKDGVLRSIKDYPIIREEFQELNGLLSEKHQIHDDFKSQLKDVSVERRTAEPIEITSILNEAVIDQKERFDGVNDDDLENISKLLSSLSNNDDFFVSEKMKDYNILPYEKEGKVHLGTPNTYETEGDIKLLNDKNTSDKIAENYTRDSIFATTKKEEVEGLTEKIEERTKIVKLIGIDENELRDVETEFYLKALANKGKPPANFVRHFLSPNHGSLFVDEKLKDFLGIEDKEEIIAQKKEMQKALRVYFKGDSKTETRTKITPKHMSRVPSLYDEEGVWREAGEFAIDMTPSLRLFDLRKLHPGIEEEWDEDVLKNIGVTERPEYEVIEGKIADLRESLDDNRGELASIFIYLLTSDGISEDILEDLNDYFSDKKVIPTNSGYGEPGDVYSPSKHLKRYLGSEYDKTFDLSSCNQEVKEFISESMGDEKIDEERLRILGFLLKPRKEDLLDVLKSCIDEDSSPPENLFKKLGEKLDDDFPEEYRYYHHEGDWIGHEKIVLDDAKEDISDEIEEELLVIEKSEENPIEYLRKIGVSERVNPNFILKKLSDGTLSPSKEYWSDLYKGINELDIFEEYKSLGLYPFTPSEFVPPRKVLIGGDEVDEGLPLFPEKGKYMSRYYILSEGLEEKEIELLRKLGADQEEELSIETLIDMIKTYEDDDLFEEDIEKVMRCLTRIHSINPHESLVEEKVWPVRKGDKIKLEKPPKAYLPDSPDLYKKLKNDLSFAVVELGGDIHEDLLKFAEFNRVKSIEDEVEISFESPEETEIDEGAVEYFKEISDCIQKKFSSLDEEGGLDWIDEFSVKTVRGELKKKIEIEDKTFIESSEEGLISKTEEERIVWFISYPLSDNDLSLISEKFQEIIIDHIGYRPEESGELKHLIYRLMSSAGEEWSEIDPDFEYDGPKPRSPGGPLYLEQDIEGSSVGYLRTLRELESSYGVCQICGAITPRSEDGQETSEKVKKIISNRGGNLKPPEDMKDRYKEYDLGNSLFLCPRHHALYMRGLVKFKPWDLDDIDEEDIDLIGERLETLEGDGQEKPLPVLVYENPEDGVRELEWRERELTFREDHFKEFLKEIRTYFELMLDGEGR